jgi:hypothetical protein
LIAVRICRILIINHIYNYVMLFWLRSLKNIKNVGLTWGY